MIGSPARAYPLPKYCGSGQPFTCDSCASQRRECELTQIERTHNARKNRCTVPFVPWKLFQKEPQFAEKPFEIGCLEISIGFALEGACPHDDSWHEPTL
jgi:hypothetical protein